MTDWSSPLVQAGEAAAFTKLVHASMGVFLWEFVISLDFDFAYLTGKRKFHWPMIPYFAGRYIFLFAVVGLLISQDYTGELNCQALYTFEQLFGNFAIGLSSINLAIRTMAIWNMERYVVIPLVLLILGHWSLILQGVLLGAEWIDGQGCLVTHTNNTVLAATFIYSMSLDFIVLFLAASKLLNKRGSSQIVRLLFKDGMVYFLIAFLANLLVTVFMMLNLNPVMNIMFNPTAGAIDTIVSCRVVRRLQNYSTNGPELYSGSNSHKDPIPPRVPTSSNIGVHYPRTQTQAGGIHVQMDTFTVADNNTSAARKLHDSSSDVELEHKSVAL
ncbi:hypothetical protein EIP91_000095 [Steccherinum ochraceum]|uniref:Uncharacterized protein n=1 Tax=Steccherinum ochraceum TaxID=92696 RepID=A0A4R0RW18_9APHY|nr:hypothetical protein EIP91_000095 [Steccherinum ochraceum]